MTRITDVKSKDQFSDIVKVPAMTVVHFWAPWAVQCESMDEAMKILAEEAEEPELKDVNFARVEAEEMAEISLEFEVAAVPTFLFFRDGKVINRIEGAKAADVTKAVTTMAKQKASYKFQPERKPVEKPPLEDRLKQLINAAPAMLFMKGDPTAPKCGFSRQTIELLDSINAEYGSFDIFSDEEVRQGLKKFSDWPTYPQLYVKGELIGGLDILKEMHSEGQLAEILPKKGAKVDLKVLINKAPVMVFMKGHPGQPKCGFSRQLVDILAATGLKYETFDILEDDEVRQGLKKFSNWPTYPQVYVKGELIGGLDIVKEMQESGDLESALKGE